MKYVHFSYQQQPQIGIALDDVIVPMSALQRFASSSLSLPVIIDDLWSQPELHTQIQHILEQHTTELMNQAIAEQDIEWLPIVPNPGKVICIGLNYRRHAEETNAPIPQTPVVFSKFSDAVAGHLQSVPLPQSSTQVDYEAELCIVIGKQASGVSTEDALDYVFGYCAANDVSARDLQMLTSQWLLGKTCPRFAPIGPYLVTADEVGDPNQLQISAYLNGEQVQHSNTSDMIFDCRYIIHYLSQHMVLHPGDIILTGTPEGVILGQPEQDRVWLTSGDQVTIEIEKLGRLSNTFVSAEQH
ncbi:fumarylacetoacetate hydrolase family protein [Paenibacillus kyungheensis]|uniref:Fumarylacetoacetate hydrolase family protein n=1 Tax=Paenibacillus kyungheensis TaxID=1452732 RepID=A0AAX3LVF6_9BACL|nr:fumarylacetoacetate hydrolase family protein [Paenibacillus kyungheensis]WCT53870.1 fumarylacetoacetate hydrolase family protein [Paenibacillus kyungheensis]